jgi:hypothetical protein
VTQGGTARYKPLGYLPPIRIVIPWQNGMYYLENSEGQWSKIRYSTLLRFIIIPQAIAGAMISPNTKGLYSRVITSRAVTVAISKIINIFRFLLERVTAISTKPIHPNPIALWITIPEKDK